MSSNPDFDESKLISFGPFNILMKVSLSFYIQVFDNRTSKVFVRELLNQEISELTQNLCVSHQELYTLLLTAFTNKTKNSEITISETGIIKYKCSISFPIDRSYQFYIELCEKEISELQKLSFQIKKIGSKLIDLQDILQGKYSYDSKEENYPGNFSMTLNSGYYTFSNQYKTVTRNANDNKVYKTIWGNKPLEKQRTQVFSIKIDKLHNGYYCLYGCIGVGLSIHHGLNIFNCKGAYTVTNAKAFMDGKEIPMNDFLFQGDIIKVAADFDKKEIKWFRNNQQIFFITLPFEDLKNFDIYPIISLSLFNETVSFRQN